MPKKKKLPVKTKLLDTKTHLGVTYEVWNIEGKLTYKIKEGLPAHKFECENRRAGTTQMKSHIKLMLEAKKTDKQVAKQMETDEDIKDVDEFEDIFDFETEDEEDGTEEINDIGTSKSEKPVIKAKAPKEAKVSESEALFDDSFEESTPPLQIGDKDGHEDVTETKVLEEDEEDPEEETVEAPPIKTWKGHIYPEVPEIEWKLEFVVNKGVFYGKIESNTYVTIKRNKLAIISRNKFLDEARLREIRVTKLKMRYVPVDIDKTLLLRFVFLGISYWLKRKEGHLYLSPVDNNPEFPVFTHKSGIIVLDARHMMLLSAITKDRLLQGAKKVTEIGYPSSDYLTLNGIRFMNDAYNSALKIFENRLHTKYINIGNVLVIKDGETDTYLMVANAEVPDEIEEIDGEPISTEEE